MSPSDPAMAAAVAAAAQIALAGGGQTYPGPASLPSTTSQILSSLINSTSNNVATDTINNDTPEPPPSEDSFIDSPRSDDEEEDAEQRLARSRERNREHARRTRLRKKAQLEALQDKVKALEQESTLLRQSIEECGMASILMGLGGAGFNNPEMNELLETARKPRKAPKVSLAVAGKRKRFVSEGDCSIEKQQQVLCLKMEDGTSTFIGGGKTHINWKSGVYCDESGHQRQLTRDQLESLRRQRNRMHAKMTRDRKKSFISAIEKNIEELEADNADMRSALQKLSKMVTPVSSPAISPNSAPKAPSPHGFTLSAP